MPPPNLHQKRPPKLNPEPVPELIPEPVPEFMPEVRPKQFQAAVLAHTLSLPANMANLVSGPIAE